MRPSLLVLVLELALARTSLRVCAPVGGSRSWQGLPRASCLCLANPRSPVVVGAVTAVFVVALVLILVLVAVFAVASAAPPVPAALALALVACFCTFRSAGPTKN